MPALRRGGPFNRRHALAQPDEAFHHNRYPVPPVAAQEASRHLRAGEHAHPRVQTQGSDPRFARLSHAAPHFGRRRCRCRRRRRRGRQRRFRGANGRADNRAPGEYGFGGVWPVRLAPCVPHNHHPIATMHVLHTHRHETCLQVVQVERVGGRATQLPWQRGLGRAHFLDRGDRRRARSWAELLRGGRPAPLSPAAARFPGCPPRGRPEPVTWRQSFWFCALRVGPIVRGRGV
mmetsp:Transcript_3895/g.12466  ORF Transcript_3895/g.12466 Transcript_3895/m.12466 type:complete len:233 (-) Transcript_3895:61-759(-)